MQPVLVFDGDCGMCTRTANLVRRRLRAAPDDYDVAPSQRLDLASLGLTRAECDAALQWVAADGTVRSGHEAAAGALRASVWWARPAGHLLTAPVMRGLAAVTYRWVADHRHLFPGGTPECALPGTKQQGDA